MEYLVAMTTNVPAGTSQESVAEVRAREAANSQRLAAEGSLLRLWRPPVAPGDWLRGTTRLAQGKESNRYAGRRICRNPMQRRRFSPCTTGSGVLQRLTEGSARAMLTQRASD